MGFAFGEDGAAGWTTFRGMEIQAQIEAKDVSERDFVYGCICLALDLLSHHMQPIEAAAVLEKYVTHAIATRERQQTRRDAVNPQT